MKQSFRELKDAVESMMAKLGCEGEITTRDPLVDAVMDALHDVDPDNQTPPARKSLINRQRDQIKRLQGILDGISEYLTAECERVDELVVHAFRMGASNAGELQVRADTLSGALTKLHALANQAPTGTSV